MKKRRLFILLSTILCISTVLMGVYAAGNDASGTAVSLSTEAETSYGVDGLPDTIELVVKADPTVTANMFSFNVNAPAGYTATVNPINGKTDDEVVDLYPDTFPGFVFYGLNKTDAASNWWTYISTDYAAKDLSDLAKVVFTKDADAAFAVNDELTFGVSNVVIEKTNPGEATTVTYLRGGEASHTITVVDDEYPWYKAGKATKTYEISNGQELFELADVVNSGKDSFVNSTVTLTDDIDLSAIENWTPIGGAINKVTLDISSQDDMDAAIAKYKVIYDDTNRSYTGVKEGKNTEPGYSADRTYYAVKSGLFSGEFIGADKTISGLNANLTTGYAGLFGNVNGNLHNFTVEGTVASSTTQDYVGGVTGMLAPGGTIKDVTSNVTVSAPNAYNVGGIAGFVGEPISANGAETAIISQCENNGNVTGMQKVGGIAGENAGIIEKSVNHGKVDGINASSKNGVGGIAGRNGNNNTAVEKGTIIDCYNTGEIGRSGQKWVGGITGFQNALSKTENCYDIGAVKGVSATNPIIGQNEGSVANSYYLDVLKVYDDNGVYGGTVDSKTGKKTAAELKAAAVVEALGDAYKVNASVPTVTDLTQGQATITVNGGVNNGYPLLQWQEATGGDAATLTVANEVACVVGATSDNGATYSKLAATAVEGEANTYSFTAIPEGTTEIVVAIKGDVNLDGETKSTDSSLISRSLLSESNAAYRTLSSIEKLVADVDDSGTITSMDSMLIKRAVLSSTNSAYQPIQW